MSQRKSVSGSFAIGASETSAIQLNEKFTLAGFTVTGSFVTGSLISFLASDDGTTFYPLYSSSSAEVTLTVTSASRCYAVDPNAFQGFNFIKARLGTSGSAKLQTASVLPVIFNLKTIE